MASVFSDASKQSVLDIVRESLDVNSSGDVSFKSRSGRGSGKAVSIPGDQFDAFVDLMLSTKTNREELAQKQKETDASVKTEEE